jgi:hypothetical protein
VRKQAMAAREVDDSTSAKEPPRATSRLPRFEQLLSRQASGVTHRTGNAIEQRLTGEAIEIAIGQPSA